MPYQPIGLPPTALASGNVYLEVLQLFVEP
jgi:hypothetical protein